MIDPVHVPLHVGDRRAAEDRADDRLEVVDDLGPRHVQDVLVAQLGPGPAGDADRPVGMRLEKVAAGVHHLRLDPEAEVDAQGVHAFGESRQAAGQLALVDEPVAERRGVVVAPPEPAVIEHEELDAEVARGRRERDEPVLADVEVRRLPAVEEDRSRAVAPRPTGEAFAEQAVECVGQAAEALVGPRQDRLGRLEGLAWLEPPAERPRVDPEAQPRRAERIDLGLGEEVARVDERQPDGLTGGLLGRGAAQHEDRVLLMARCAPLAASRAQARLESRLVEAELAAPGAGVLDEGPVGIGQVERGAHDGRQRERVRPAVHEPDAARHDRPIAVDRRQHVGGEAARTVDEDDLDGLGLGVVLGVRGGQAVEGRLAGSDVVLSIDELEHAAAVGELDRERRLAEVTAAGRRQLAQGRVRHAVRAPDERMALEVGVIATDVERCPEVEMRERAGRQDPHDVAEPAVVEMELAGRGPPFDGHRLSCRIAVVGAGERWARAAPMVRRAAATSPARWGDAPPRGIRACRADRHRASRRRPRPRP